MAKPVFQKILEEILDRDRKATSPKNPKGKHAFNWESSETRANKIETNK